MTDINADFLNFSKPDDNVNSKEILSKEQYDSPHPNPHNSYGETYGAHREFLEFDLEQNKKLMDYCKEEQLGKFCRQLRQELMQK